MLKLYVCSISLIVAWFCSPFLYIFFAWHFSGDPLVPYGAQDIQMLKFGQIVDLDLIERSAPNKYVQDRWVDVTLWL